MSTNAELYEQDLYAWTQEQAARLREGAVHELDLEHLIEEIEDAGYSQRDALASHLLVLLTHLLKLAVAARERPGDLARAGRGWQTTCRTQRRLLDKRLRRNPSLAAHGPGGMRGGLRNCQGGGRDHARGGGGGGAGGVSVDAGTGPGYGLLARGGHPSASG